MIKMDKSESFDNNISETVGSNPTDPTFGYTYPTFTQF